MSNQDERKVPTPFSNMAEPTTSLIAAGIQSVTQLGTQLIGGAQANKAARDEQTFLIDYQKEQNRAASVANSFSLVSNLREKRFSQQDKEREAEANQANPLNKQTKYLLFAGAGLLAVGLVIVIIFLNKK